MLKLLRIFKNNTKCQNLCSYQKYIQNFNLYRIFKYLNNLNFNKFKICVYNNKIYKRIFTTTFSSNFKQTYLKQNISQIKSTTNNDQKQIEKFTNSR